MHIKRATGNFNPYLEVFLYCNQFQLATADALYSDGSRYIPATTAVKKIGHYLPQVKNVLVLGAGLGSMVHVLSRQGYNPDITLVEKDKVVLELALEFMDGIHSKITPICNDAALFIAHNTNKYDFIFVDIFIGRVVPEFVFSYDFLARCKESLNAGGYIAFNYIVNNKEQWESVRHTFGEIFDESDIVSVSVNRILTGRAV